MKNIIQVLGPTGVGKSRVSIQLALAFCGEIISADSAQVYKDFDIGTDKLPVDQRQGIPHHLIDILTDGSQFNASLFLEKAFKVSQSIVSRDKVPIVCGGTALYLRTMIKGIFPESKEKRISRAQLNRIQQRIGLTGFYNKLQQVDPGYAEKIGKNDRIRIIRAMEIFYNNGIPPSEIFKQSRSPYDEYRFIRIGLNMTRETLYQHIEKRVDRMMQRGLLQEVEMLLKRFDPSHPAFKSLGYKEILLFLNREISLDEAVALIKQHSRNFAKRQLTWFRKEEDIKWFRPDCYNEIESYVALQLS